MLGEANALLCERIKRGCFEIQLAITAQLTIAKIIDHDVDDIWPLRSGVLLSSTINGGSVGAAIDSEADGDRKRSQDRDAYWCSDGAHSYPHNTALLVRQVRPKFPSTLNYVITLTRAASL